MPSCGAVLTEDQPRLMLMTDMVDGPHKAHQLQAAAFVHGSIPSVMQVMASCVGPLPSGVGRVKKDGEDRDHGDQGEGYLVPGHTGSIGHVAFRTSRDSDQGRGEIDPALWRLGLFASGTRRSLGMGHPRSARIQGFSDAAGLRCRW